MKPVKQHDSTFYLLKCIKVYAIDFSWKNSRFRHAFLTHFRTHHFVISSCATIFFLLLSFLI